VEKIQIWRRRAMKRTNVIVSIGFEWVMDLLLRGIEMPRHSIQMGFRPKASSVPQCRGKESMKRLNRSL
jgi:hypothetical protein